MAYQMKSSPAKLMGAIKLGAKIVKYGTKKYKSLFSKTKKKKIEPTYYNTKTRSFQSTKPQKVSSNPFTDPNKAKKTYISDNYNMRTDYTNEFLKKGKLKTK